MNIATLLMFTIDFNGENQFFSDCKKSNIDLSGGSWGSGAPPPFFGGVPQIS